MLLPAAFVRGSKKNWWRPAPIAYRSRMASSSPRPPARPPSPHAPAIELKGVVKAYGSLRVVDGLDLEVPAGVVLGLLGPNGAGKSTTMRMLTAQSRADSGTIRVLGHEVPRESKAARAQMGVVPQHDNLDEELTTGENLEVFAHLYRIPRREREGAVRRALALAHLEDRRHTRADRLSGGMRRRLLIARGLVHRPRVVLLDEPTVGLDPQVRQELWGVITDLRNEGVTVLMSTHYIEEAERLSDEVALMAAGRVVSRGVPGDLVAEVAGKTVEEFRVGAGGHAALEEQVRAAGLMCRRTGPSLAVLRAEEIPPQLRDAIARQGTESTGDTRAANLEDVFVALTGEEAG
ncbi:ATP-binding cassette domain-containing protein [Nocardiopsis coralliicola]